MERIAIIGAMAEEVKAYESKIKNGKWHGKNVYVGITGVGKTAAAATTQRVISELKPELIIFTGFAGALDEKLKIGEVGICLTAIDSDLDVRAWNSTYQRGELPFTHGRVFYADSKIANLIKDEKNTFFAYVASGSAFLDAKGKRKFNEEISPLLRNRGRSPILYDMETSAVLQVVNMNHVPALPIRVVSDTLKGDAVKDFNRFMNEEATILASLLDKIIENI